MASGVQGPDPTGSGSPDDLPTSSDSGGLLTRGAFRRFLLFAVVAFLTRAVLLGVPTVDLDEAVYLTGARQVLRGGVPYVDFADHKPPLVFAYYAAAQLLGDGMLPVRLLTSLLLVPLVAFAASAFFRHDRRGLLAGLVFLVWSAAFLGHDMLAVNCEILMLGPLALAVVALRDASAARRPSRSLAATRAATRPRRRASSFTTRHPPADRDLRPTAARGRPRVE